MNAVLAWSESSDEEVASAIDTALDSRKLVRVFATTPNCTRFAFEGGGLLDVSPYDDCEENDELWHLFGPSETHSLLASGTIVSERPSLD